MVTDKYSDFAELKEVTDGETDSNFGYAKAGTEEGEFLWKVKVWGVESMTSYQDVLSLT